MAGAEGKWGRGGRGGEVVGAQQWRPTEALEQGNLRSDLGPSSVTGAAFQRMASVVKSSCLNCPPNSHPTARPSVTILL